MIAQWLITAIVALVGGGFAIPAGFTLGLGPVATYLATVAGATIGAWGFILLGDWVRHRFAGDEPHEPPERIRRLVERYGAKGLGLVGPTFPGVTASALLGIALGMPRGELARWMTVGIVALYAVYTVVLWAALELFS